MKEHPILFSGSMVRALLDGSKTQTRRVMSESHRYHFIEGSGDLGICPYGATGDRLWVRESFWGCDAPGYGDQPCVVYDDEWYGKEYRPAEIRPWARKFGRIPSIHMPRDCSRITLEIVDVRIERLNDCSHEDAEAEGIRFLRDVPDADETLTPRQLFMCLWDSINEDRGLGWDTNPWVWVIEFKRIAG